MTWNEFINISDNDLVKMLDDVLREAEHLENECRERFEEQVEMGMAYGDNDPACDYVADDLYRRADTIRAELRRRGVGNGHH